MSEPPSWPIIWREIRSELVKQPPCPDHPEYRFMETLVDRVKNDVLAVHEDGVTVRSHEGKKTKHYIEAQRFKTWWDYLVEHGSASLNHKDPNNPHWKRPRIVGAILATCLPNRIHIVDSKTIKII